MNTKSKNLKVEPEFEDLFTFSSKEDKIDHRAQMISYRILSEIEKLCSERNMKMKDLAAIIETSASYVTQLFRGNKQVNTAFMAKCEEALNVAFNFSINHEDEQSNECLKNDLLLDLQTLNVKHPGSRFYCAVKGGRADKTSQLLEVMEEEQKKSQNPTKQAV